MRSYLATLSLFVIMGCGDSGSGGSGGSGAGNQGGDSAGGAGGGGGETAGGGGAGGAAGGGTAGGAGPGGAGPGGGGPGGAGGAGGGGLAGFAEPCAENSDCESGVCHNFPMQGGMLCTETCMNDNDCPAPSSGCNNMGFCRPS